MEKKRKNANRIISITLAFALVVTGLGMGSWGIEGIFAQTQKQDKQVEKTETSETQSNKQQSETYTLKANNQAIDEENTVGDETSSKTGFLKDLYFADRTWNATNYVMTSEFNPETDEYTLIVPDNKGMIVPYATLNTDVAPSGSSIKFNYIDINGKERSFDSGKSLTSIIKSGSMQGNQIDVVVGTDDNNQTYKINVKRQSTISEVKLTDKDNNEINIKDSKAYIPYDGININAVANVKDEGNIIKINGEKVSGDIYNLDASKLWKGEAGSRSFDITIQLQNEKTEPSEQTITFYELPTLTIANPPQKTTYKVGEKFDKTGMVIKAAYHGSEAIEITDYTISPSSGLKSDNDKITITYANATIEQPISINIPFEGKGTKKEPYLLSTSENLKDLSDAVASGEAFSGKYFKFTADITLPDNWTPIGSLKEGVEFTPGLNKSSYNPFSGYIDGDNHLLTVPKGSKTMLGAVSGGKLSNLKIYGEQIDGYGVVEYYYVDRSYDVKIEIDNVTLKSGTHTKMSGFIGGYASGVDKIIIKNSKIEKGVIIGNDGTVDGWDEFASQEFSYPYYQKFRNDDCIGSFAGMFNGTIENCVSYATVYGNKFVGGILGAKGQSMGDCIVRNSNFYGSIEAKGEYVGGIAGDGYASSSAPNTPAITIENCGVTGSVKGSNYVGGILGGEQLLKCCWNNGIGYIRGNYFAGTLTTTDENGVKGGIIGYMNSLNCYNIVSDNYFVEGSAENGIGLLNEANLDKTSEQYRRTDDPIGKDKDKIAKSIKSSDLTDGTLKNLLNKANTGINVWKQGTKYPVQNTNKRVVRLISSKLNSMTASRFYQNAGYDAFDNYDVTVVYSDGSEKTIKASKASIKGIDFSKTGYQLASLTYGGYELFFGVNVVSGGTAPTPSADDITVKFTLLGDIAHKNSDIHTLKDNNLQTWISETEVTVPKDSTVLDVFSKVLNKNGYSWINDNEEKSIMGSSIKSITNPEGITLGVKTNTNKSDWMYTINNNHIFNDISEQKIENNDTIVFHYTDDYSKEDGVGNIVTVNFDADNGNEVIEKNIKEGQTLNYQPENPTKDGYVFVGWYKDIDDITTAYKNNSSYTENITYKAKYAHVTMLGAQVKNIVNNKSGIRFGTRIYKDGDKIVEKGTLILPANLLKEGEALTLDTPKIAKSLGTVNYEEGKDFVTYLGSIVNIPDTQFDRQMTASAYVVYRDKAGNEYTVYAPYKTGSISVNDFLK